MQAPPTVPAPVSSWPALVMTALGGMLFTTTVMFFVFKAAFDRFVIRSLESEDNEPLMDRIVIEALERSGPALRKQVDALYAKELEVIGAMDTRITENSTRNTWVDGQLRTLNEQMLAHNEKLTEAIDRVGDSIERSAERAERTMEKNDRAIENLTTELAKTSQAVAKIEGFLKAYDWNGAERRRVPRDD